MKERKNPLTRLFGVVQATVIPVSVAKLSLMAAEHFIPQNLAMAVELLPEEVLELPTLLSLNAPKVLEIWLLIWQWAEYGLPLIIGLRILLWLLRNAVDLVVELFDRLKVLGCRISSFIRRLQVVDLTPRNRLYVDIWDHREALPRETLINIKACRDYNLNDAYSQKHLPAPHDTYILRYRSDTKEVELVVNGKPHVLLSSQQEVSHGQLYFRLLTY